MTISVIKNVFNAGEISPKVYARTDIDKHAGGCKTLLNMLPIPQGGAVRRPGFEYVKSAKNNNTAIRLVPFVFSTTQAYVMEFGPAYIRFYKDGGQIQGTDANTSLLIHADGANGSNSFSDAGNNSHTVTTNGNAQVRTDQKKFGTGSVYFGSGGDYLSVADHADWFFNNNAFTIDFWARRDGGAGVEALFSQMDSGGAFYELTYSSNASQLLFGHHSGAVYTIALSNNNVVLSNNTWYHIAIIRGWNNNSDDWALTVNGAPVDTDTDTSTMNNFDGAFELAQRNNSFAFKGWIDEFRVSKSVARWTGNFTPPVSEYPGADDSGAVYEVATSYTADELPDLQFTQSYDTLYITHRNHAPAQLVRSDHNNWALNNVTFAANSQPAAWSNNNGWPRACAFYQDRLVFAGTTTLPSRLWFSKTGNYTDLTTGANDADGMELNLLSGTSDTIVWLSPAKTLLAGTDTGIQSIAAATGSNTALTPTNKRNFKESYFGSAEVPPIKLGDIVIHAGNPAAKVRELAYSWQSDGFKSTELTVLADHLLEGYTVKEFAYQQTPFQTVWVRRSDNTLLALTYMQEEAVVAWSRHTSGSIAAVACIPGETEDELWAAVHRNINNNTVTGIERLRPWAPAAFNDSFFLDGAAAYNGAATTTITGLDHLNGANVTYLADGVIGTATIANNSLSLNNSAAVVAVGIPYTSEVEPLPVEVELSDGPGMFETKRITEIALRCRNSAGGTYGPDGNYQAALLANNAFTDGVVVNLSQRGGFDPLRTVLIRQTDPLPLNIDAIGMEVDI